MDLKQALNLQAGNKVEALAQLPSDLGITRGKLYLLTDRPRPQFLQDILAEALGVEEYTPGESPSGAIFTLRNDHNKSVNLSYAFFR